MLRLTLVRHAKAEPAEAGQEDRHRALDVIGRHQATEMGRRLQQRNLQPDMLATSTALRALSTSQLLARELAFSVSAIVRDEQLYLISAADLLDWIRAQTSGLLTGQLRNHLMVVAHNPGLSEFAARIAAVPSVDSLPTCATYTLCFENEQWHQLNWHSGIHPELDFP